MRRLPALGALLALELVAGLVPRSLGAIARRLGRLERFVSGQRAFSAIMVFAGLWLVVGSGVFDPS